MNRFVWKRLISKQLIWKRFAWLLISTPLLTAITCSRYDAQCAVTDPVCNPLLAAVLLMTPTYPMISEGFNAHTVVRFVDGTVRSWGGASNGRLGNNQGSVNTGDGVGPSIISSGDTPIGASPIAISAGHQGTCALFAAGNVKCWGFGGSGRLGYGNTNNIGDGTGPTIIAAGDVPIGATVSQISHGPHFTCAVLTTGAVKCWGGAPAGETGYNSTASVGDGTGLSIIARGDVPLGGSAQSISVGANSVCAVLTTGAVRCWGSGASGLLGYNNTTNVGSGGTSIITAGDVPLGGTATQVSVGASHACALLTTGAVRCWGAGTSGALGYNSTANVGNSSGTSIILAGDVPLGGKAIQIAAGSTNTCALMDSHAVRCWGLGSNGRLGYNSTSNIGDGTGPSIIAAGNVPIPEYVVQITTGSGVTCAVIDSYRPRIRCWGGGGTGALGYNSTADVGSGTGQTIITAGDVPTGK